MALNSAISQILLRSDLNVVIIFFLCISDKLVATRLLGQFYIFLRFYTFVSVACRLVKETVQIVRSLKNIDISILFFAPCIYLADLNILHYNLLHEALTTPISAAFVPVLGT